MKDIFKGVIFLAYIVYAIIFLDKHAREGGIAGVVFGILAVVIVGAGLYSVLFNTSGDEKKDDSQ